MSSKRAMRRRACDGKTRFVTFIEADSAMRALVRKIGNQGRPLSAYRCKFCNGFHFGHVPVMAINARKAA